MSCVPGGCSGFGSRSHHELQFRSVCTVHCNLVLRYWLSAAACPGWRGAVAGLRSLVSLTSPTHPASDGGGFSFWLEPW